MKQVVISNVQLRINGQIYFFHRGDVVEYDEEHPALKPMEDKAGKEEYKVDFTKASEEELMAASWTFSEASDAMYQRYGIRMAREENMKKKEVVRKILDIRYRSFNKPRTDQMPDEQEKKPEVKKPKAAPLED